MNGRFLSPGAFASRKQYFNAKGTGVLREMKKKGGSSAPNPMADPSGMMDMMKNNVTFLVPNMLMMTFISYFFSGFVLVKVPFPLTNRFKIMMQRGVDLATLDVSYVSSLSWYFLVMFGLRGFFTLILGADAGDALNEEKAMQAQMGMGMGGNQMGFDAGKAAQQEKDSLELVKHHWVVADAERKLLGARYPARAAAAFAAEQAQRNAAEADDAERTRLANKSSKEKAAERERKKEERKEKRRMKTQRVRK